MIHISIHKHGIKPANNHIPWQGPYHQQGRSIMQIADAGQPAKWIMPEDAKRVETQEDLDAFIQRSPLVVGNIITATPGRAIQLGGLYMVTHVETRLKKVVTFNGIPRPFLMVCCSAAYPSTRWDNQYGYRRLSGSEERTLIGDSEAYAEVRDRCQATATEWLKHTGQE